jgi:hypothetical protein
MDFAPVNVGDYSCVGLDDDGLAARDEDSSTALFDGEPPLCDMVVGQYRGI